MFKVGKCVVIGDRKCKLVGDIRGEYPEDYEHVDVHGFDFNSPCEANEDGFINLTQRL